MRSERIERALFVSWVGLWINVVLTTFKFIAGFAGNSAAMVADAVHSLSDFATDIVAVIGFRITGRPVDRSHDYGHGKFETLTTVIVGVSLLVVAAGIFYSGGKRVLLVLQGETIPRPGMIALIAAIVSIVVKEWLYLYTKKEAISLSSDALMAKAWDHRSDALSSVGTLLGIGGAIFLGPSARILDPIAAMAVGAAIVKVALPITIQGVSELLEESLDPEQEQEIMEAILNVSGVEGAHHLRTRRIGANVAVEVHILVNRDLRISDAHDISTVAEDAVRVIHGEESFISVHVEPRAENIPDRILFDDGHNGSEDGPGHHERVID
ncbi:MAG: cation diffusion facilitator family transporter [Thermovirgaceae bacterium]|nr:cation diffusion facilitator family transporter [Thermovirgaceae bacterium]